MYAWGMDKMDGILALLTPDEVGDALHFVEVWQKAGHMSPEELRSVHERRSSA